MRTLMRMLLALTLFCTVQTGRATTIELAQRKYLPGERVKAMVNSPGDVTIENDITATSMSLKVNGEKEVDLGTIGEPGLYGIRVLGTDAKIAMAAILVMPHDPRAIASNSALVLQ